LQRKLGIGRRRKMSNERNRMQAISNIVFNSTQSDYVTKDQIIDSLIKVLRDFNKTNPPMEINDWRNQGNDTKIGTKKIL
jgi:hypothetical protein